MLDVRKMIIGTGQGASEGLVMKELMEKPLTLRSI